jgi:transposase-like protein
VCMPHAGNRDIAKEQYWRQVLADWQSSGLSIASYCRQKDIKQYLFHDWRRQVQKRDAEQAKDKHRRMVAKETASANKIRNESQRAVEFAEVRMIETPATAVNRDPDEASSLEIVFPSGTKVRLTAGCPLDLFASVVRLLEKQ